MDCLPDNGQVLFRAFLHRWLQSYNVYMKKPPRRTSRRGGSLRLLRCVAQWCSWPAAATVKWKVPFIAWPSRDMVRQVSL